MTLSLNAARRGGEIEKTLPSGVAVRMRPLTAEIWEAVRVVVSGRAAASAAAVLEGRAPVDAWPEGLDPSNESHRLGFGMTLLNAELAALCLTAWEGVEEDLTPDAARDLVRLFPMDGDAINRALMAASPLVGRDEGNG